MDIASKHFLLLLTITIFSWLQTSTFASKKSYIVYLGGHAHSNEDTNDEDFKLATDSHYDLLESILGSKEKAQEAIFYSYTKHINGFAARLDEEDAMKISKHPRVLSSFESKMMRLHTTRSWEFVGQVRHGEIPANSIWARARLGNNTIIGNLDTGVWPESKSFGDEGMGPVPLRWKGHCENNTKAGVPCNRKLIGAKYYSRGYESSSGEAVSGSARDLDGHGTHTLSTAAGNRVPGASMFGYAEGTAAGGSPAARAAAYKVCWNGGCDGADILAAFDSAISDGVDVISISLGASSTGYMDDPIAIGAFHATVRGIPVVCSGGNAGPDEGSVSNGAPWITTVAASTLDRVFPCYLTLGNKKKLEGQSLSSAKLPANKFYPLIKAENSGASHSLPDEAAACYYNTLDPKKVKGKIVVCLGGSNGNIEKGEEVLRAGGAGMIIVNDEYSGDSVTADPFRLPATNIGSKAGPVVFSYMSSTKSPVAYISAPTTRIGVKPAPVMTDFSSRGPNIITPQILKPDITAPGYNILAAFTGAISPTGWPNDTRRIQFNLLSGTSMSCPHVAGVSGLLRTLYPSLSPAAIRSAIMTTARTRDNTGSGMKDYDKKKATPFAYGSGHIWMNRAMDPGLVYDLDIHDYLNFLCALGYNATAMAAFSKKPYKCPSRPIKTEDLNYPAIVVPQLHGSLTVTRTVKNVGTPGTYRARVVAPVDISVSVKPGVLKFGKVGEEKAFQVAFRSEKGSVGPGYGFGGIIWSDGKHYVRTPLAVNAVS